MKSGPTTVHSLICLKKNVQIQQFYNLGTKDYLKIKGLHCHMLLLGYHIVAVNLLPKDISVIMKKSNINSLVQWDNRKKIVRQGEC